MAYFTITAPVKGRDDKTRYPRVGVLFENHNRETGEVFYTIRLDFPVGVTEMVAFPPKPRDDGEVTGWVRCDQGRLKAAPTARAAEEGASPPAR